LEAGDGAPRDNFNHHHRKETKANQTAAMGTFHSFTKLMNISLFSISLFQRR
jgi:hypothetical protein